MCLTVENFLFKYRCEENAEVTVILLLQSYCQKHSVSSKKEVSSGGAGSDEDVKKKQRKDMTSEEKSHAKAEKCVFVENFKKIQEICGQLRENFRKRLSKLQKKILQNKCYEIFGNNLLKYFGKLEKILGNLRKNFIKIQRNIRGKFRGILGGNFRKKKLRI